MKIFQLLTFIIILCSIVCFVNLSLICVILFKSLTFTSLPINNISGPMSSHGGSESVTASLRSKSSQGNADRVEASATKKRKRNTEPGDDVDTCISTFLKRVPEIDKNFDIIDVLGDGTFSYVFHGKPKNLASDASFALKYIIPTSASWRITNEIRYLKRLGGKHNVCDIKCIVRHHDNVVLVLPYFSTTKFIKVVQDSNQLEIQRYLRALFEALAHVHRHNVIHRDIKPSNFLYDREKGTFLLVDFGLAEDMKVQDKENVVSSSKRKENTEPAATTERIQRSQRPNVLRDRSPRLQDKKGRSIFSSMTKNSSKTIATPKISKSSKTKPRECSHLANEICNTCILKPSQEASRAGTPGFRSPEMLMKHPNQTTAVDIWAAGVIFLSLLSMRYPFFKAADDLTSLCQIITLLGSDMVINAGKCIGKQVTLSKSVIGHDLKNMCNRLRQSSHISRCDRCEDNNADTDRDKTCPLQPIEGSAYDLLALCLDPNPHSRITAEEALKHEFFECFPPPPIIRKC